MPDLEDRLVARLARAEAAKGIPRGLSIVTPADPNRLDHFEAAEVSVARLRDAAEFAVEWIVCLDGAERPISGPDIVLTLPAHRGISVARNWALTHATGDIVFTLDADDMVMPDGLIVACERLASDKSLGWVAGMRTTDQGKRLWHPLDDECDFAAGDTTGLLNGWVAPFHPNAIVARRQLLLAVGGWAAVPTGEDWVMAVRLNRVASGKFLPYVVSVYRKWDGQVTREYPFKHERGMVRKFVRATDAAAAEMQAPLRV